MSDLPTSGDGQGELFVDICYGLEGEYDIHNSDRSTARIYWCEDLKQDIRKLSKNRSTKSQTEIEMVMCRKAIDIMKELLEDSILEVLPYLKSLAFCAEAQTSSRQVVMGQFEGVKNNITNISIEGNSSEKMNVALLREDSRKIRTDTEDYGFQKNERLKTGLSYLIQMNENMFSEGLVDNANDVVSQVETQLELTEGMRDPLVKMMGSAMNEAINEGEVYTNQMGDVLRNIKEDHPEVYEMLQDEIPDGYEVDVTRRNS